MKRYFWLVIFMVVVSWHFGEPGTSYAGRSDWRKKQSDELAAIRGVVKPVKEATISAELQATVQAVLFRDGQRFKKGEVLIKFRCEQYRSELAAAQADYEGRQAMFVNNQELVKLHGVGALEVRLSEIEMKKSSASLRIARLAVRRCTIAAPFSGRVVKTLVHPHESVNPYDELMTILDDGSFEIELILPSSALRWLKPASGFTFNIDENQQAYPGKVVKVGARIDPVSQTIRVFGTFTKKASPLLAGMSGTAMFPDQPVPPKPPSKSRGARYSKRRSTSKRVREEARP